MDKDGCFVRQRCMCSTLFLAVLSQNFKIYIMHVRLIVGVDITSCQNLNGMLRADLNSVRLPDDINWKKLCVKIPAQVTISEKYDDKVKIYTASMKLLTKDVVPNCGRFAFRIHLSDGKCRLIGTNERPYPVVSKQENMPDSVKDNQLDEVTITYSSTYPIPYII